MTTRDETAERERALVRAAITSAHAWGAGITDAECDAIREAVRS